MIAYSACANLITIYLVTRMRGHVGGVSQFEDVLQHHEVGLAARRAHQLVLGQPLLVLLVARVSEE